MNDVYRCLFLCMVAQTDALQQKGMAVCVKYDREGNVLLRMPSDTKKIFFKKQQLKTKQT